MNSARKIAAALLLFGIAGCKHKVQSAAPPAPPAQVYTPNQLADQAGRPEPPAPKPADVKEASAEAPPQPAPAKRKSSGRRKPTQSQAAKDAAATPAAGTQQASAGQPPDVSPIGQLSSSSDSGGSSSTPTHQSTADLIKDTENRLNGIKRKLTSDEEQTANQVRTFLNKARQALEQNDLDGAFTLATKAKVLLEELMK